MNIYSTEFFSNCPVNGIRVKYQLEIKSEVAIPVEQILAAVDSVESKFHEEIADDLVARFGGEQTLVAEHHGVKILTVRSAEPQT